jgi:hypothetical protein
MMEEWTAEWMDAVTSCQESRQNRKEGNVRENCLSLQEEQDLWAGTQAKKHAQKWTVKMTKKEATPIKWPRSDTRL